MHARPRWRRWARFARRIALAIACLSAPAQAISPLPYDGSLYLNGEPVDGLVEMRFSLWNAPEGGNELWAEAWTVAESTPVSVRAGRFTARLGSVTPFERPALREIDNAWLSIAVRPDGAADWHALGGRQRAKDFVYAGETSGSPGSFDVDGDLTGDNLRLLFGGEVRANGVTVLGELNLGSSLLSVGGLLTATEATISTLYATTLTVASESLFGNLRITGTLSPTQNGSATGRLIAGRNVDVRRVDRVELGGHVVLDPDERSQGRPALNVGSYEYPMRLPSPLVQVGVPARNTTLSTSRFQTYTGAGGSLTTQATVNSGAYTQPTGTLSVGGTANVGQLHAPNCRLCLQFLRGGAFHMCVRLDSAGARSGFVSPGSNWGAVTEGQLILDCNNNQNSAGRSTL